MDQILCEFKMLVDGAEDSSVGTKDRLDDFFYGVPQWTLVLSGWI